nr:hypothetical protein [Ktedonobacter racemifer]
MDITQVMRPTALMKPLVDVVPRIKIAAQHSLILVSYQVFDDFSCTRVMVLVVAHGWGTHTPDVSVDPILSPAGFIGL